MPRLLCAVRWKSQSECIGNTSEICDVIGPSLVPLGLKGWHLWHPGIKGVFSITTVSYNKTNFHYTRKLVLLFQWAACTLGWEPCEDCRCRYVGESHRLFELAEYIACLETVDVDVDEP